MEKTHGEFLWVESYRPKNISDCILPPRLKEYFQVQVDAGELQNMLLVGGPGTGKTTVAKALCNELGIDVYFLNASKDGNIDTLRTKIQSFASTMSFKDGHKCVILDEADYLTAATQPALRSFIEEYSKNCRFILTANYSNKIIEPLKSRCAVLEFKFSREEKKTLIVEFDRRIREILANENIEYNKKTMAQVVMKYFPDFRKTINELQRHSQSGCLADSSVLAMADDQIKTLVRFLKEKDFSGSRKWIVDNIDNDFHTIQRALYESMYEVVHPASIPQLVLTLSKYDYQHAFCVDKEINIVAMFVEIMAEINFK